MNMCFGHIRKHPFISLYGIFGTCYYHIRFFLYTDTQYKDINQKKCTLSEHSSSWHTCIRTHTQYIKYKNFATLFMYMLSRGMLSKYCLQLAQQVRITRKSLAMVVQDQQAVKKTSTKCKPSALVPWSAVGKTPEAAPENLQNRTCTKAV